jgi:hypothetical protein
LYNNVSIGGQFSFVKDSGFEAAGLLAIELRQLSPDMLMAVDVGVGVKYISAPVSVKLTPQIGIGINKRSAAGNKEIIAAPLQVAVQAAQQIAVFLDSGIRGPSSHFGDLYQVPLGLGASFLAMHGLDVGAEFMLPMVAKGSGYSGVKAFDNRYFMLFASWRNL